MAQPAFLTVAGGKQWEEALRSDWVVFPGAYGLSVSGRPIIPLDALEAAFNPDGTVKEEPLPVVSKATVVRLKGVTKKSWTQDRTDYWINRAKKIAKKSPRLSLLGIAKRIVKEEAPDHLPDDQREAWKKKGWTIENIHRRLKGHL